MKRRASSALRVLTLLMCAAALAGSARVHARQGRAGAGRPAAPRVRFADGRRALKLPLEMDGNIFFLRVSVNGSRPLKFLFDTGATVSAIDGARAKELGLRPTGRARGSATGGAIEAAIVEGVTLGVTGAEVTGQPLASVPFGDSPVRFDGIIGYDFIKQFVVELDYRGASMTLHDPRRYAYRGRGAVVPLLLAGRRTPLVRTRLFIDGRAPVRAALELDTGADGTFLLNSPFVRRRGLRRSFPETARGRGSGLGGEQARLVGRVRAVEVGRVRLDHPPVALSLDTEGSGADEGSDGIIGGEVFRRFRVVLDYSRRRMMLEPNESFGDPFEVETGGPARGAAGPRA